MSMFAIHNRRYLGNKFRLIEFIQQITDKHCINANSFMDLFGGTGIVAHAFSSRYSVIVNDILQSNFYAYQTFFGFQSYSPDNIADTLNSYNKISNDTLPDNYYSLNFADTFLSRSNLKKVGFIRDDIDKRYALGKINDREKAILITSLIYAVDKIANTVGHYDAYRKNGDLSKDISLLMPEITKSNLRHRIFNEDANQLVLNVSADIVYLDPPYNSRQYCDSYHFLENIATNLKPEVMGVARKMDRSHLKSHYCTTSSTSAFEHLIDSVQAKYILLSYNSTADKANSRSNAKLSDEDILRVLQKKGKVGIEEIEYKAFTTGKTADNSLKERIFYCLVDDKA